MRSIKRLSLLGFCLPVLLLVLVLPQTAGAADSSTLEWALFSEDPDTGDRTYDFLITMEHGGTYEVPFDVVGKASVDADVPAFSIEGELFFVPNPDEEVREHVTSVGRNSEFMWTQEGTYELDVYQGDPPELSRNPAGRFLSWLLGETAHAQNPELFIETIRFNIAEASATEDCCSSVVFLPGIKGSVLKNGSDTLWPPTLLSNDVPQLALDENGESVNDIVVDGVLNSFYGTQIYGPFGDFLDELVTENVIEDWLPLAYDWRYMPDDILDDGVVTPDGTIDLLEEIESLASSSPTGKVTLVAHSMGGLMGKAIIKRLEDVGKDSLIDAFIIVGSPQLGTPQAIASMLHGDDEGIAAGFIVNTSAARELALGMPSAYSLLPSPAYAQIPSIPPTITFDSDAEFTESWRSYWGDVLSAYDKYREFMIGQGVVRQEPDDTTLRVPQIADSGLFDAAAGFHATYDTYAFPESIRIIQIAGWGLPTVKAVEYRENHWIQSYDTSFTREGDRTVVYASAVASEADETYFLNIFQLNKSLGGETQHRDLLSASPVQEVIESVMQNEDIEESSYISVSKPTPATLDDALIVGGHSPIVLGAYDQSGNFTGIDPDQDLSAEMLVISEEIPGSIFLYSNETQYIFLPKEGQYTFAYQGTGNGPTTVSLQNFSGDVATLIAEYSDISTTPETNATFMLDTDAPEETVLEIDVDGNGVVDSTVHSDDASVPLTIEEPSQGGGSSRVSQEIQAKEWSLQEKATVRALRDHLVAIVVADVQAFLKTFQIHLEGGTIDATVLASLERRAQLLVEVRKLIKLLEQI